jgi:hypothetical protein
MYYTHTYSIYMYYNVIYNVIRHELIVKISQRFNQTFIQKTAMYGTIWYIIKQTQYFVRPIFCIQHCYLFNKANEIVTRNCTKICWTLFHIASFYQRIFDILSNSYISVKIIYKYHITIFLKYFLNILTLKLIINNIF